MKKEDLHILALNTFYLADGNPGAISCINCITSFNEYKKLDAQKMIDVMDIELGLRGSRFYMLWNDCCDRDVGQLELLLYNFKKGFIMKEDIIKNLDQVRARPMKVKSFEELELENL